jgi:hypothetical protein
VRWVKGELEKLNATGFRRTAAVVRHRGHVLDGVHFDTEGLHGTHGGLTTGTGATKTDFSLTETMSHRLTAGILRDDLGGVGGAFAGTAESHLAGGGPADHATGAIRDGDDGVVEGGVNVDDARRNVLGTLGLDDLLLGGFATDFEPDALGNLLVTTGGRALICRGCGRGGGCSGSGAAGAAGELLRQVRWGSFLQP